MASDLTPWFPADVKPVRAGLYEVRDGLPYNSRSKLKLTGTRRYFDGETWRAGWQNEIVSIFGAHSTHQWRGLASKP